MFLVVFVVVCLWLCLWLCVWLCVCGYVFVVVVVCLWLCVVVVFVVVCLWLCVCGSVFVVVCCGRGPAGNTGRGSSWLRSGREHWARMVVVEVRQGTLGADGRG